MRYNGFMGGKVLSSWKQSIWHLQIRSMVRSTISMRSMLMPPENFEKLMQIESEAILESKYMHLI